MLTGRLLILDALGMDFMVARVKRNRKCPACGDSPSIKELLAENYTLPACSPSNKEDDVK